MDAQLCYHNAEQYVTKPTPNPGRLPPLVTPKNRWLYSPVPPVIGFSFTHVRAQAGEPTVLELIDAFAPNAILSGS